MKTFLSHFSSLYRSWIPNFFRSVYLFFPGIIFLVLYGIIVLGLDAGQDMLMQATEYMGPLIWTIICMLLWSIIAWYSARIIEQNHQEKRKGAIDDRFLQHFPRILGYFVPVIMQIAAINLPSIYELGKYGIIGFVAFHIGYYFCLMWALNSRSPKAIVLSIVPGLIYLIGICLIFYFTKQKIEFTWERKHIAIWLILIYVLFIYQILFCSFVVSRRERLDNTGNVKYYTANTVRRARKWFNIVCGVALLVYIFLVTFPWAADWVGSLGITMLAFALWVGFIYLMKYIAQNINLKLGLPILICIIIIGLFGDPYNVQLNVAENEPIYSKRNSLDDYINNWFGIYGGGRKDEILKSTTYPIYLIIADGGASKSGYWVASVLAELEKEARKEGIVFSDHILSLAGASGGSVGNAAYYSMLKHQNEIRQVDFTSVADSFFGTDFLSYDLAHMFGSDIVKHGLPFLPLRDRARALEHTMEAQAGSYIVRNQFAKPIEDIFDSTCQMPLFFMNTTNLESGMPGVISNVQCRERFSSRIDLLTEVDCVKTTTKRHHRINFSTAVILGSRFPYISPAGEVNEKYYVDGGYFDNSGAGITLELMQHLEERMNNRNDSLFALKDKLKFRVIYISNGDCPKEGLIAWKDTTYTPETFDSLQVEKSTQKDSKTTNETTVIRNNPDSRLHPLVNDLAAPLMTVLGTYSGQTSLANERLRKFMRKFEYCYGPNSFIQLNLPMDTLDKKPYPMNWVISNYNLNRMKGNLKEINYKLVVNQYGDILNGLEHPR